MREIILAEIRRIAADNGGKPPGSQLFQAETGIAPHKWLGVHWAKWSDALSEAGYSPNDWQQKLDSNALLHRFAEIVRAKGGFPSNSEILLMRRTDASIPNPKTLRHHFEGRDGLIAALRTFCSNQEGFGDVIDDLPETRNIPKPMAAKVPEGWVYLLKSGQHYKIGRSDQLETRVKQISIALPEATTMVHAIRTDDPPGIEAYWHRRFADRRANGEWFKLTGPDVAAFTRRKFQ